MSMLHQKRARKPYGNERKRMILFSISNLKTVFLYFKFQKFVASRGLLWYINDKYEYQTNCRQQNR